MATLVQAFFGRQSVYVRCTWCTHFAQFKIAELSMKGGPSAQCDDIQRRLLCTNCGRKQAYLTATRPQVNLQLIESRRLVK